jgi:hypothetical protein
MFYMRTDGSVCGGETIAAGVATKLKFGAPLHAQINP